ncbi:hypothetical protein KVR01_012991 [Diaporthe batatas]|uniref:uncharacterized protein n=1 Tax=Diaporthe batatas TaxID=748121 RepID=UPI001D040FA0|nr:uncharacterized protein KVR01_012991 [Diaporthe batatas]KAG8157283.1 hypothetical protein KVR01_012991 [Diaporthe batatas]
MDHLRVKHVTNELRAIFSERAEAGAAPRDFAQIVRSFCHTVAVLLICGLEGYRQLNFQVANNYHLFHEPADFVYHAVLFASRRWNLRLSTRRDLINWSINSHTVSNFVANRMRTYDVYFRDHPERVKAYGRRYRTVSSILDAKVDVEAMGEPYEIAPLPLSNGRIGCLYCNLSMSNMDVLTTHHEAVHQDDGMVACTDCTWTSAAKPGALDHHLKTAHDIYPAGHPHFFSTSVDHLCALPRETLVQLVADDLAALARLCGEPVQPPAPTAVPASWGVFRIAFVVSHIRVKVRLVPGWEREVEQAWNRRVVANFLPRSF